MTEPPVAGPGDELIAGYGVIEHVRRGEDLDTYEVYSATRYCRCFVKTLRPDRADDASAHRRLGREARLLLSFTHPHLVRAYEYVETTSGLPALVMETLGGATVAGLLERTPRLVRSDLCHLGTQLCSAIAYLHDHGVLHLDVKPGNVICDQGHARLIDLSLARAPGNYHRGVGTSIYMAPEQALGGELGPPADVWGIGLLVYEAATGVRPFESDDASSTTSDVPPDKRYAQLSGSAAPIRTLRRLPSETGRVLDSSLASVAGDRPTVGELAEALGSLQ